MGLFDAFKDEQFRQDLKKNARDFTQSASNTAASLVTGPVDIMAWLLKQGGLPIDKPVGGSDWATDVGLMRNVDAGAPKIAGETFGLLAPLAGTKQGAQATAGLLNRYADNLAAPRTLNPQAGMIRTEFGRIPETLDERIALQSLLEKNALASGYKVSNDAAFSGASLYSTITNPKTGAEAIVRLSNHQPAMKYVPRDTPYFSVSPDQGVMTNGGTFEQAVQWLGENNLPIKNIGPRYEKFISSAKLNKEASAAQAAKEYADAIAAKKSAVNQQFAEGAKYIFDSTKLNSGGRRYDIKLPDGSSLTAYSKDIPDSIKTGARDDLVKFILERNGMPIK